MLKRLNNIRVVLVQTTHPGNIGSAARAMKTMGLSRLYLVKPKYFPHADAQALASGALDVLEQAVVTDSLEEALADCHLVFATSVRARSLSQPLLTPRQCAERCTEKTQGLNIGIVFGREHAGLTNEELQQSHYQVCIPANEAYSSLNLAAAVQLLCYELRVHFSQSAGGVCKKQSEYATIEQTEDFYRHLEQTLLAIKFIDPKSPKQLMPRLRRLFNRVRLETTEVNLLRGILKKSVQYQPSSDVKDDDPE